MTLETTLVNGEGSIALAAGALPVGVHTLPITYTGDDRYASSRGTVVVTVTAKRTDAADHAADDAADDPADDASDHPGAGEGGADAQGASRPRARWARRSASRSR